MQYCVIKIQVFHCFKLVKCSCAVSLFSNNELLLFANLGHTVDGSSCVGIEQG